ncbi:hypothetical protein [Streptomyces sp. cf386]|uniref:hypothetical protein n=1 Tax=Streptomyces sp. cf386 TaxID=1761904 RepID=UPI000B862332|nr:hypothetical protein [Streptomyces sp. cf386]
MNSLQIFLCEEGAEAERLEGLAGVLRQDLLQLEVDEVTVVSRGDPPAGARGVVVEAGALLVSLGTSVTALRDVLSLVTDWWRRSQSHPTIRLEMDGDVLVISDASLAQLDRSFELFVNRHSPHEATS